MICNVGDLNKDNWYTDCVSLGVSVYSLLVAMISGKEKTNC